MAHRQAGHGCAPCGVLPCRLAGGPIDRTLANQVLAGLPAEDRRRLLAQSAAIELAEGQVLCRAGRRLTDAYFPTDSLIALVAAQDHDHSLGVGLIGHEGVLGAGAALGTPSVAFDAVVQAGGHAWRVPLQWLASEASRPGPLRQRLADYLGAQMGQLVRHAACSRFHSVAQRLARWLLMTQDGMRSDDLLLTHEFLAGMLGAQRARVTVAAGLLQARGLIRYTRGHILVLDRAGLLTVACNCYRQDLAIYREAMGSSANDGRT